jgi:diguanylate cyclase (GGDEF)-like protein
VTSGSDQAGPSGTPGIMRISYNPARSPAASGTALAQYAVVLQGTHKRALDPIRASILVVDPDPGSRARLVELGREHCIDVSAVDGVDAAVAAGRARRFDATLIDVMVGGAPEAAFELARALRSLEGNARLPIAFLSYGGTMAHRVEAVHAGGLLFLAKPIDSYTFGAAMEKLVSATLSERPRVLIVDDDDDFGSCVAAILEGEGMRVTTLTDPSRVLELADVESPDLVLLDVTLPGVSGFDVARMLRTMPRWQDVPILFLTGRTDLETRVAAFESGGDDYLSKPIVEEELLARVRMRLERRKLLRDLTEKDSLTKLLSRRALLERLASRLSEARRHARKLSIALLDVDEFKRVNDTHGHAMGDHVLAALGQLLAERFRFEDLRGRWGGEEFVIVFPGESARTAAAVLRRVLAEFRAKVFRGTDSAAFHVTFSAGIASFPADGASVEALMKAADLRMYQAKESGRNTVVVPPAERQNPRQEPGAVVRSPGMRPKVRSLPQSVAAHVTAPTDSPGRE